jgi:Uma2 family endonuclease
MATGERKSPAVLFRMTSDEFCRLPPSDSFKLELLDGEVHLAARPAPRHQHFAFQLGIVIDQWAKRRHAGRVLLDTLMKLDGGWTPAPDLCFLTTEHLDRVHRRRIIGPVDLAVEILSTSGKKIDRKIKFATYARFGIPWYWIVDLDRRFLEEYELVESQFGNLVKTSFDQPFTPREFPGLVIDLASLEW